MILGAVFLGVKVIEYSDKIHHHLVPGPNFQFHGAVQPDRAALLLALLRDDRAARRRT